MGLSVGEIQATLTLRDQTAAGAASASANVTQSVGVIKAQMALAQQAIKDYEKAIQEYASSSQTIAAITPLYEQQKQKVADLQAQLDGLATSAKTVTPALDDVARGMSSVGQRSQESMVMIGGMSQAGREAAAAAGEAKTAWSEFAHGFDLRAAIEHPAQTAKAALMALAETFGPVGIAVSAAALGFFALGEIVSKIVERTGAVGASIQDSSYKTGAAVEATSRWRGALEIAGSSLDQFSNALFMMQRRMVEAGPQFQAGLDRIGFSMRDLQGLEPDQQFLKIAQAIRAIEDPALRSAAAMEIFGRPGRELLPLIMKNLEALNAESERLGSTWSAQDAKAAEEFEMASRGLNLELENIVTTIGRDLIPIFTMGLNFAKGSIGWLITNEGAITQLRELGALMSVLPQMLGVAATAGGVGALAPAATKLAAPEDLGTPKTTHDMDRIRADTAKTSDQLVDAFGRQTEAVQVLQAHLDFLRATVVPLTAAQREQAKTMLEGGDSAKQVAEELTRVSQAFGGELVSQKAVENFKKSMDSGAKAAAEYSTSLQNITGLLAESGVEWDWTAEQALRYHASVTDVARVLGDSRGDIQGVANDLKAQAEASKEWTRQDAEQAKAVQNITDALAQQGVTWDWTLAQALDYRASQGDIAKALDLSTGFVKGQADEIVRLGKAHKEAMGALHDWTVENDADAKIAEAAWKIYAENTTKWSADRYTAERAKVEQWKNDQLGAINYSVPNWLDAYRNVLAAADSMYVRIALDEQDALNTMHSQELTWGNEFQKTFADLPGLIRKSLTGGGGMTGAFEALTSSIGGDVGGKLFMAGGPLNSLGNAFTKGATDLFGSGVGNAIGMALPGIGTAIGAMAPMIIDMFKNLFGGRSTLQQVAEDGGKLFGMTFSDNLTKQIADDVGKFGGSNLASMLGHLKDIIGEAGGLDATNLENFTGKLHDVFSLLQQGLLTTAQATKILDANWQAFAAAGTDADGRLSDSLKQIIQLQGQFGTQSKEITAYLQGQGATAMAGFVAAAQGLLKPITDAIAAARAAAQGAGGGTGPVDLTQTGAFAVGVGQQIDRLKEKVAELNALPMLDTQQQQNLQDYTKRLAELQLQYSMMSDSAKAADAALGASGKQTKASLDALGIQAVASYAAAVAAGKSQADALRAIGPGLDALIASYQALGLSVDDVALKNLLMQEQLLKAAPELVDAISGLTQEMVSLDNMGLMNRKTLEALEASGLQAFAQIQAKVLEMGGTDTDVLLQMQTYLQEAAKEAALLGIPLDANTQALIDQSKELGIWGETGGSSTDKLLASMTKLTDKVSELVDRLMGVSHAIDDIPTDVGVNVHYNIPDMPQGYGTGIIPGDQYGGGGSNPYDPSQIAYGGAQAAGGDYLVTRPTMFIAGDDGPERATFSGAGNLAAPSAPQAPAPDNSALEDSMSRIEAELRNLPFKLGLAVTSGLQQSVLPGR